MEEKTWKDRLRETAGRHSSRRGAFSAGLTALAVAAVVVFNLVASQLPESWAQFDLTGSGIYDISDTSRTYLDGLEEDVEIHVLTDKDTLDSRIVRFLDIYADLSDHLTLEYTDPTVYPSALTEYGVEADTVVVTCDATGLQESFDAEDNESGRGHIGVAVEEFRLRALTHGVKTEEDLLQKFCRVQLVSVCIIPLILLLNKVIEVGEDGVILRL